MAESRRSPLLDAVGAVEAAPPDEGIAAHYGDPDAEQRQLLRGEAVVDLSNRDVLTVAGADRLSWLNDVTTQNFATLEQRQWVDGLILNPQGRVQFGLSAYDDGEQVWLHTEQGQELLTFLHSMVFINRVELADVTEQWAILGQISQLTQDSADRDDSADGGNGADPADAFSYQLIERSQLGAQRVVGVWAWEALRIAAGLPRVHEDTDDRTIPNEIGMPGVSITKGMYTGLETVLKVHNLGKPPRRLVRLHLDGSVGRMPAVSSAITHDDQVVGWVGTSARHHQLGPIALGTIKRNTDPEAELLVDSISASQQIIVDPQVGLHVRPRLQ